MIHPARSGWLLSVGFLVLVSWGNPPTGLADNPTTAPRPPAALPDPNDGLKAVVPLPLAAIPDDPPPHEGALIDLPLIVEPPDILVVEVLEALPGRPISGERLVRPDGTISLGFYGNVHVRGLTLDQTKVKIIHHLRYYLADQTLGLLQFEEVDVEPVPQPGMPKAGIPKVAPDLEPIKSAPAEPKTEATPKTSKASRRTNLRSRRARVVSQVAGPQDPPQPASTQPVQPEAPMDVEEPVVPRTMIVTDPVLSNRVFVDIAKYTTGIYYIQGDVGSPGRVFYTGRDTVLDALNYAGGLIPTAEPTDIHLYRPARGGKPTKDYLINRDAILKGDAQANLQLFPNDRLVVGRNPVVKKTIEINRISSQIQGVMASYHEARRADQAMSESNFLGINLLDWCMVLWRDPAQAPQLEQNRDVLRAKVIKRLLGETK